MAKNVSVLIPKGYALSFSSDAVTSGTYVRLGDPGGSVYTPTAIAVSSSYTIGPFNEDRTYLLSYEGSDISYSLAYSGVYTAADESGVAITGGTITGVTFGANLPTVTNYNASGAISVNYGVAIITKSSAAAAMTLAAPAASDDGKVLVVTSRTAKAHTITATSLINDGVTGGAKTTATFAAFAGASITLMAINQLWHVISSNNVTIS